MILHQLLYQNELTVEPNIADYIESLVDYISQASNLEEVADIEINIAKMELPINLCVHIGLIFNELITNIAKYGFIKDHRLKVSVSLSKLNNGLLIQAKDNGPGFPVNMKISENSSFGLGLVKTISQQYEGKVELKNDNGALVEVFLYEI